MAGRWLLAGIILLMVNSGYVFANESKPPETKDVIKAIIESTLGKAKIIRKEEAGKSPLKGFNQIRVWFETPYGETPVLIYVSEDGKTYVAGSVFDSEGNNLTQKEVGETKPRTIKESDMQTSSDYTIGPKDAKVRVVLWIGTDKLSRTIYDSFSEIYQKNTDRMSLSLKFLPRSEQDARKMTLITCRKGKEAFQTYEEIKDFSPFWGTPEDLTAYLEKHGMKEKDCDAGIIRKDAQLLFDLGLPQQPLVFVNGTMMFDRPTSGSVGKMAGVELR
jgi:hypothetical protein